MKHRGAVFFDIDGVLADFEGEFCERFGYDNRGVVELEKRYSTVDPGLVAEFIESASSYENLSPIFGGRVLLDQCRTRGYKIVLVTSRPQAAKNVTITWLEKYNITYNELIFTKDKLSAILAYKNKNQHIPVEMLVDDLPTNLHRAKTSGVIPLCWEQEWNSWYYPKARYNVCHYIIEVQTHEGAKWRALWDN